MKRNEYLILSVFFIITAPGSIFLFENKYTTVFLPLICLFVVIFSLKNEILKYDLNLLKDRGLYYWSFKGIQYGIYTHALGTVLFGKTSTTPETLLSAYPVIPLYIVITGPIIEEIVFRKIIFGNLHKKINFYWASSLSSLLYAAIHFNLERLFTYTILGVFFCYIYKKSRMITSTIMAHFALNFIALVVQSLKL